MTVTVLKGQDAPGREPLVVPRGAAKLAESVRNVWELVLREDVPDAELLSPSAWGPDAAGFLVRDLVYVQGPRTLRVLRVIARWPGGVQMVLLDRHELPAAEDESKEGRVPAGYVVERDPVDGWRVRRLANVERGWHVDVTMVKQSDYGTVNTREAALRWLLDHASLREKR